ncbi:MAG: PDGLE domain-containing protein [Candidatus Nanopelagicales bacterium]
MRRGVWAFIGIGMAVSLLLAGVVSHYASRSPDGLEKVAADVGFLVSAQDSAAAGSPLAGYGVAGVADERISVGLAGAAGVLLTAALAFSLFMLLARRGRRGA